MQKSRQIFIVLSLLLNASVLFGQSSLPSNLAHTFSIVARDSVTGEMGVAVQTHWFAVGTRVAWAESGVGTVATQSFTNSSFGPRGLKLVKRGKTAEEALQELIDSDEGRDVRQVAIIDFEGNVAAWTGKKCIKDAGHMIGGNFAVQANLMLNDRVWPAMAQAFEKTEGPLAERMVAALEAGQNAGGDIRGKQSAALLVVRKESTGNEWDDKLVNLRVDDHANPIQELKRLLRLHRAYRHMNAGDKAMEKDDIGGAMREYGKAQELNPDNLEMKYWHAIALANAGLIEKALPMFKEIFSKDKNWRTLTERLPANELLIVSESDLQKILAQ